MGVYLTQFGIGQQEWGCRRRLENRDCAGRILLGYGEGRATNPKSARAQGVEHDGPYVFSSKPGRGHVRLRLVSELRYDNSV
jgi:hypothetical protein